jgi:rare lipoprotein A
VKCAILLCCVPLMAALQDGNSKPSPIGSRRSQAALAPAHTPDFKNHGKDSPAAAPIPNGPDTGIACYYRQKPAQPGEVITAGLTGSHNTLPKGTKVKVTNLANQKSVVVTITEHSNGTDRIICLSEPAANQLGFVKLGTAQVRVEKL